MNDHLISGVFAAGLIQACQVAVFSPSVGAPLLADPAELAGGAYGTWCLANALGWAEARKRVSPALWPQHLAILKAAGVAVPLQGPVPTQSQAWFGVSSHSELVDLLAKEPWRIMRLLHAEFRVVAPWGPPEEAFWAFWPVGTQAIVASIEFMGDWRVVIERLGEYPEDWPDDMTHNPSLEINDFFRCTQPLDDVV